MLCTFVQLLLFFIVVFSEYVFISVCVLGSVHGGPGAEAAGSKAELQNL